MTTANSQAVFHDGIGFFQHAGQVAIADGTKDAEARLKRVLWNDPALGVIRHADAGYEKAKGFSDERGVIAV